MDSLNDRDQTIKHDLAIIASIRAGDKATFDALYLTHFSGLHRLAIRFVQSADSAEDIVQDVFFSLWTHRSSWSVKTTVQAYLYRAVRNRCISVQRHQLVIDRANAVIADTTGFGSSSEHTPETQFTNIEDALRISQAIQELPERQRMAFALWWDELSPPEIAEVMDVTPPAVRKLLGKAYQSLRGVLER